MCSPNENIVSNCTDKYGALMQTEPPRDSVTMLNLKIGETRWILLDLENDQADEERRHLEQECGQLANT
jgi:hypothetical protein